MERSSPFREEEARQKKARDKARRGRAAPAGQRPGAMEGAVSVSRQAAAADASAASAPAPRWEGQPAPGTEAVSMSSRSSGPLTTPIRMRNQAANKGAVTAQISTAA